MTEKATTRRQATADLSREGENLAVLWVYPELEGRLTVLRPGRTILGRDYDADVRLPGEETSRQHAEILTEAALVVIRDLNSTNGVYVDGKQTPSAPLEEGSVVRIGDWVGVVLRSAGPGPAGATGPTGTTGPTGPIFREILPGYFGGPKTLAAVEALRSVAQSDLPIVIEGETGTGKEGVARAAHEWSRRSGPFVAVNCAALPEALAEGELFGYRKGAFTGADRSNAGYFQAAHQGTLFLDEVVDLLPAIQPKLLRVLEQREVTPLGEAKAVPIDVRVVVATQSPLEESVRERRFRPDLFARLNGLHVRLPPLRSRPEEVPNLFARLLAARTPPGQPAPQMDAGFVERLCCYDWPLNIRELALLVRKLVALHGHEKILKRSHIPELAARGGPDARVSPVEPEAGPGVAELALSKEELEERQRIVQVLADCAGSQSQAARRLNISRSTLIDRLKRYGIRRPRAGVDV
jgi:transcriptional regulator of acetoin/glycerol metabolism